MPRQAKSQWDFGELFPASDRRAILTVTELTLQLKRLLEKQVGRVWVSGEISNLRLQASGHMYFTLKDAGAQLSCVLFRGEAGARRELLQDGGKVLVQGEITVYEARGQYQLVVRTIELQGVGALQLAFERLKQKLNAEGLFAPERKRPLPRFIQRIGLVTSPTGAALRDVLTTARRRYAALEIVLTPVKVQGEGAAAEIAAAIGLLNEYSAVQDPNRGLDLILVCRGGGSLEDLWAFNEEPVARAIFHSTLPVISAIGHEIDFTISDFVADARAATPTAAAEIITEDTFASRRVVAEGLEAMRQAVRRHLVDCQEATDRLVQRLGRCHPRRRFNEHLQRMDDLLEALLRQAGRLTRERRVVWRNLALRLLAARPSAKAKLQAESLRLLRHRLSDAVLRRHESQAQKVDQLAARLRLLSPEQVLARGYSITREAATDRIVRDARTVAVGAKLKTRLFQGEIESVVTD